MRAHSGAFSPRHRDRSVRTRRGRRALFERLEERTTPTVGFGYATALGGPAFDSATSIATDNSGNTYVVGTFRGTVDFDPGPKVLNLTSTGNGDEFLAKYDPTGSLLWVGHLANTAPVNYTRLGVATGPGGDVYITGLYRGTTDFDFSPGVSTLSTTTSNAAFVARYSSDGALRWARSLGGGTASPMGNTIAVDASGNVYSAGVMGQGSVDLDPGSGTFLVSNTNSGSNAATYLSELDSSGNFVWGGMLNNAPTGASAVWPADLTTDTSQNVYITGLYIGTVDFDPGSGTIQRTSADSATTRGGDAYVVKLTPSKSVGYVVSLGSDSGREDGNGIAVDSAGNAYVTGDFESTATILAPDGSAAKSLTAAGVFDLYVMKLDTSGNLVWVKTVGSSGSDEGREIALDASGSVYLTGLYSGSVDFDPGAGSTFLTISGGYDAFVMQLDTDGQFGWASSLGGPLYDLGSDIAVDGQGNVFSVGRFQDTADFDPTSGTFNLTSAGGYDGYVSKLSQATTNQAPSAADDTFSTDEDTPLNVPAPGVLVNDSDPNGDTLSAVVVTGPANGTLSLKADGSFTYTPNANYNGSDSFTYQVSDGSLTSNVATVTLRVNAINDAPTAEDQSKTIDEDTALGGSLTATDVEGDTLTYSIVNGPTHGQILTFDSTTGAYTYQPAYNYNGSDSFTFLANDGTVNGNVATVSITVNPVNDRPFASPSNQAATTNEDTAVSGQLTAVDAENDPLTFSGDVPAAGMPAHGSVIINSDGTYTYTPDANFNGTDQFVFQVADDKGAFGYGVVTVRILPVSDAPVAADDTYSMNEDEVLSSSTDLLSRLRMVSQPGDFVGQGYTSGTQPLVLDYTASTSTFAARTNYANGVEILVIDSSVVGGWTLDFSAPNDVPLTPGVYTGAMRFGFQDAGSPGLNVFGNGRGLNELVGQFTVFDVAYGASGTIMRFAATFVQQGVNSDASLDPPLSGALAFQSTFGTSGGILANDTDVDGDFLLSTSLVTGPAHGDLNLNPDGTFTYTPDPNFFGTDSFTYQTSDGSLTSNTAMVTIDVAPINDAPVAQNGTSSTDEDVALTDTLSASDVDSSKLTYTLVSNPSHGTISSFNSDTGEYTYTPDANFNGSDSFTFQVSDGFLTSNDATQSIQIAPVNDPPVAANDDYSLNEDSILTTDSSTGVLANDTDIDGGTLSASVVTGPANGTLSLNADGSFTYTPDANYNGSDSFTYRVSDGSLTSNVATVTLRVNAVNDPPTAEDQVVSLPANSPSGTVVGTIQANDVDNDPLTYTFVSGNTGGAFAIDASSGQITVVDGSLLDIESQPQYVIQVSVADPSGLSALATMTINLTAVNENLTVLIDIQPGSDSNSINLKSHGKIDVAILSSPTFDALSVDVESLLFGRTGTEDSESRQKHGGVHYRIEDINGDGLLDLVVQFEINQTDFQVGDTVGILTGKTISGVSFVAQDDISPKTPGKGAKNNSRP